jgi:hypothetical protein
MELVLPQYLSQPFQIALMAPNILHLLYGEVFPHILSSQVINLATSNVRSEVRNDVL